MASRNPGSSGTNNQDYRAAARPQTYVKPECIELLPPAKLADLLHEVAPGEVLDKDVIQFLQEHVDEFVESVTEYACRIAKHRNSRVVEARDFQVHLENKWNIRIPGYGDDPRPPTKRNISAPVHNARMHAIAKTQQQHLHQEQQQQQQQLQQRQQQQQQQQQPQQQQPQQQQFDSQN